MMWSVFGVRWRLRWPNNYETLRVALEVAAFLQIAIAELAGCDLDIIPGTLLAEIELTDKTDVSAEPLPDNSVYHWRLLVPRAPLRGTEGVKRSSAPKCLAALLKFSARFPSCQMSSLRKCSVAKSHRTLFNHDFFARRLPRVARFFFREAAIWRDRAPRLRRSHGRERLGAARN